MLDRIVDASRKPMSVALSALMAALLVPVTTQDGASAYADDAAPAAKKATQEAGWSAAQQTNAVTGLPSLLVNVNGGTNDLVSGTVNATSLTAELIAEGKLADPTDVAKVDNDAQEKAKDVLNKMKDDGVQDVANANATDAGNKPENKDNVDASKLTAAQRWYNDQLNKSNKDDNKVYQAALAQVKKQLEDAGIEVEEGSIEINLPAYDDAAKVSYDTEGATCTFKAADVKKNEVTIDSSLVKAGNPTWTNPSEVDVTSAAAAGGGLTGVTYDPATKNVTMMAQAASDDAGVSLGYSWTKTLDSYLLTASGDYNYDYMLQLDMGKDWTYSCDFTYSYKVKATEGGASGSTGDAADADKADASQGGSSESGSKANDPIQGSAKLTDAEGGEWKNQAVVNWVRPTDLSASVSVDNESVTPHASGITEKQDGGSYTSPVKVIDLFPENMDAANADFATDAAALTYYTDRAGKKTTNDTFAGIEFAAGAPAEYADANRAKALEVLGQPQVTSPNGFEVEYSNNGTTTDMTVKAKNATYCDGETAATETATLTWTLGGTTVATHTVEAMVKPLNVEYTMDAFPFRLQDSQEKYVLEAGNQAVADAVKAAAPEGVQPQGDCYTKAELSNYKIDGAAQTLNVTWTRDEAAKTDKANGFGNYKIVPVATVSVNKMETPNWEDTGLKLNATHGVGNDAVAIDAGNCENTWIKSTPSAVWDGHKLAYAAQGVPASKDDFNSTELQAGDGIHTATMYAYNEDDDTICEVQGIKYCLDTLAPVITGWDAGQPYKTIDGIFFSKDQIDVTVAISDKAKNDASSYRDEKVDGAAVSGVATNDTSLAYYDNEGGRGYNAKVGDGLSVNNNQYTFSIEGDKEVDRDSIHAWAADNAGNVMDTTATDSTVPMEYLRLVNEVSAPSINATWDTYDARHGRYYQTNRTLTLTIDEVFFEYVQQYANYQAVTTVYRNGAPAFEVHPSDFQQIGDNTWQYTVSFTDDADYDVTDPTIVDIVDRSASTAGDSFTVDKTAPTMEVSFDNNNVVNGKYYQQARTATITINEHNFSGDLINVQPQSGAGNGDSMGAAQVSGWSDSGDIHTATVTFPGEGVYSMTIDGVDLADNVLPSYSCEEFVVDTIDPEITIQLNGADAPDLSAFAGKAEPSVSVHDTNINGDETASATNIESVGFSGNGNDSNPYTATKNAGATATDSTVTWSNPDEKDANNDGVYQLVVTATDLAGRTSTKAVVWSVNRFGSTYRLLDDAQAMSDQYLQYNAGKVKDVQVQEINPSGLDGSQTSVELTKDSSNSTLSSSKFSVEPGTENDDTTGWHSYTYKVNRDNFTDSARYQVTFHSKDNAANVSENTMQNKNQDRTSSADVNFWVDDVKPICNIIGVEQGKTYETDSQQATVQFEDNLKLDGATVTVTSDDGAKQVHNYSADDLKKSTTQTIELDAANSNQTISVVAHDAAGNVSDDMKVDGIYVNADKVALWMHNTPLFIGSIVGGVAAIAAAIAGAVALVRKRKAGSGEKPQA